ncbi:MAG: cytochrome b [Pseudomonadota bacterium]
MQAGSTTRPSIQWLDSAARYGLVSRMLHWGMVALMVWQFMPMLACRIFGESVSAFLYRLSIGHGTLGTSILLLVLVRGGWGLLNLRRRRNNRRARAAWAAMAVHLLLYALMFAIPTLALLRIYGSGPAVDLFGFPVAGPTGARIEWIVRIADLAHGTLAWTLLVLAVGHGVMALFHHCVLKDDTLLRMASQSRRPGARPCAKPLASTSTRDPSDVAYETCR